MTTAPSSPYNTPIPCSQSPALPVPEAHAFPDALVRTPHWVGYAWEVRGEQRTKVPKNPHWRPDLTKDEREHASPQHR